WRKLCAVCLIFMIGEVIDGYTAHSLAIMTDASCVNIIKYFIYLCFNLFYVYIFIISLLPECKKADLICTFLFSLFVLGTTFTILKDIFKILMEGKCFKHKLMLSGVKSTHSLHMWSLTTRETQLSVHTMIYFPDEQTNPQTVLMDTTRLLQTQYGFSNITIQTEMHTDVVGCCLQCQDPMD
uniref:Cation efflux protein cytoplasmic domain-containing protein n=1 Tax=Cyprinus carpio TaxID=7962 RepID=A0A8C1LL87_CYPCA